MTGYVFLDLNNGFLDGVGKRQFVGAAVALHHYALEAQQAGAVISPGIYAFPDRV